MSHHHVIAKVGSDSKLRVLFVDLDANALSERFIKPYEKGTSFFSGNDLISPNDLRSVHIVRTERPDAVERDELNRKVRESIDRLNELGSGVFFLSVGGGYKPQDIAEAGVDVTHDFIKGAVSTPKCNTTG
ncbi:hypothetical protein [Oryzisolibacter sp. LB2S]|uniref:hypothetical protein n=1 Tax=Alicycliphilus soli TaxID=3228789 RepID=UPI00345AA243